MGGGEEFRKKLVPNVVLSITSLRGYKSNLVRYLCKRFSNIYSFSYRKNKKGLYPIYILILSNTRNGERSVAAGLATKFIANGHETTLYMEG